MTCTDPTGCARAPRIAAVAALFTPPTYSGVAPIWACGDSHIERQSVALLDGAQLSGGHPVLFAGIAGATFAILRDCVPWSAIAATHPAGIIVQGGVNDANNGVGYNADGTLGPTAYQPMLDVVALAKAIAPVTIATDPPPEQAAGINAARVFYTARMLYYIATNQFGGLGAFPFVDQYWLMRGNQNGTPASQPIGVPCYAAAGATLDNVHWPHAGCATMLANLAP